jgi:hypothetical protein
MKQQFKGLSLTTTKCVNNILKVYNSSDKFISSNWYVEANSYAQTLAILFNVKLSVACGVIAALSPLKSWDENKKIAHSFLKNGKGKHTKAFVDKALQIKQSNGDVETIAMILNGNKIVSFFINILEPTQENFVTIDRHALSIALGRCILENEGKGITLKQYEFFVNCYKIAGLKAGISAVRMQSITWETWRLAKKKEINQDVPF